MDYLIHSLTVLLLLFCLCDCQNTNTTSSTTDGVETNSGKTALQKGIGPVLEMTRGFLDTVFKVDFYGADDGAFTQEDLQKIVKDQDIGALTRDWQKVFKTFGGYAACIIMGLLFVVAMPIVGLFFCCCNCCCGRCGRSKKKNDPKRAKCKRVTYTTVLLIFTTLMLAGGIITFLTAELLHVTLKNEDGTGFVGQVKANLQNLNDYIDDSLKEVVIKGKDLIVTGTNRILPNIKDAAIKTSENIKNTINATEILKRAEQLGNASTQALKEVTNLNDSLEQLASLQENVTQIIDGVKSSCTSCNISISFGANYSGLDRLQTQVNSLLAAQDISSYVDQASKEFTNVSSKVNETVLHFIEDAENKSRDLQITATKQVDDLIGTTDSFGYMIGNLTLNLSNANNGIAKYGQYIWYGHIGLGSVVILVVAFYYLGVLFGLCGERPGYNAACCNRGTGANLLCTGVCCSFLFAWLLMLVVVFTFMVGSLVYALGCKHLQPVEGVAVMEDFVAESMGLNLSASLGIDNLTLAGSLRSCRDNEGLYTALKLSSKFNLDKAFDLTGVKDEVKKMVNSNSFSVANITLLSADLERQLDSFQSAGLSSINFTTYKTELDKEPVRDLNSTIKNLRELAAAAAASDPQKQHELTDAAEKLEQLQSNQLQQISTEIAKLRAILDELEKKANFTNEVGALKTSLKDSQDNFNAKKDELIRQGLNESVVAILNIIDDVFEGTKNTIKTAGRCRPLYDSAQGFADSACLSLLDPFNGFWFGLGWSLFFFIPCFIFAVLLMDLYRRTESYVKKSFDDPNHTAYAGYNGDRGDDNIPLTRRENSQTQLPNGARNYAYEGRESKIDSRYHRDQNPGNQSAYPGSPMYAQPYAGNRDSRGFDAPPRYDDAIAQSYNYHHDGHDPMPGNKK